MHSLEHLQEGCQWHHHGSGAYLETKKVEKNEEKFSSLERKVIKKRDLHSSTQGVLTTSSSKDVFCAAVTGTTGAAAAAAAGSDIDKL